MKRIAINENDIHMVFEVRCDKVRLVHFSALPLDENTLVRQGEKDLYFPSEIQVTGRNRPSNWHGAKIVETSPGYEMKYLDFRDSRNDTRPQAGMGDRSRGNRTASDHALSVL